MRPFTEPFLRTYHQLVYDWLGCLTVNYGDAFGRQLRDWPIIRVNTTVERAFADAKTKLLEEGIIPETYEHPDVGVIDLVDEDPFKVVPLPFASISFETPVFDVTRNISQKHIVARNADKSKVALARYPRPFNIDFTINVWTKKMLSMAHIEEWILGQVGAQIGAAPNEFFLLADHGEYYGKKLAPVIFNGVQDVSNLEPSDSQNRMIRHAFNFTLKGWLMYVPDVVGSVTQFNVGAYFHNAPDGTNDLETLEDHVTDTIIEYTREINGTLSQPEPPESE